ncbi:MAG: SDR family NAD(P)-dependent oxidoreductase [Bacteroidota bacterium]
MNRIILAYSPANADLAQKLHETLIKSGISPEHVASATNWPETVFSSGLPVVMLVTDNLLTDRKCMAGLLSELGKLPAGRTLVPVIADGKNADGEVVPTAIDRMVNMLHYMNHWQNVWMKVSSEYQNLVGQEKQRLEKEMDAIRELANEMSEIITLLRAAGPVSLAQFEANNFSYLFSLLGIQRDYTAVTTQEHTPPVVEQPPAVHSEPALETGVGTTETAAPTAMPYSVIEGGIFTPVPVGKEPEIPAMAEKEVDTSEEIISAGVQTIPADEAVEQTIRDADFWIQQGFIENGLELLRTAREFYPENERINRAYEVGMQKLKEKQAALEEPATGFDEPEMPAPQNPDSYWKQGLTAVSQGDYLYAKYCWDRVAEINPEYPGIYRSLGLMAAEHLANEYRETAVVYLKKALSLAPDDTELAMALGKLTNVPVQPEAVLTTGNADAAPQQEPVAIQNPDAPVVLITGATSGIGRATAEVFARNGYRLILNGRRRERLDEIAQYLKHTYGADVLPLPFDVRRFEEVESAVNGIPDHFRQIDVLINNAGLAKGLSPIHEGRLDHWETMIDTNIKGVLYVTRMVSPGMVERRKGHIVNISSSAGKEVYPNGNVYCATKFAVEALTKGFRSDLYRYNVRVSQVSPGHVEETEFAITRFDGDAERARIYDDFRPLKSSDVAEAIWFMVSRPEYVNIQDVHMFGTQQASSVLIDRSGR